MLKGSNCDRKSQFSEILTEPLNPRENQKIRVCDKNSTPLYRRVKNIENYGETVRHITYFDLTV